MTGKYTLIYADPPWVYRDKAADGDRGAEFKYPVMNVQDICRLPVWDLAADSCLLAMWWVPTQPVEALKVIEAWGFRLMTMKGFTWHKTNKHKGNSAIGMGHMTRANSEDCLFAVRGKLPARMDASICQHVTAPRMENLTSSAKNWCNCWAMCLALSYSPVSRRMASMFGGISVMVRRLKCCQAVRLRFPNADRIILLTQSYASSSA